MGLEGGGSRTDRDDRCQEPYQRILQQWNGLWSKYERTDVDLVMLAVIIIIIFAEDNP
jgi:hypothetical protein